MLEGSETALAGEEKQANFKLNMIFVNFSENFNTYRSNSFPNIFRGSAIFGVKKWIPLRRDARSRFSEG